MNVRKQKILILLSIAIGYGILLFCTWIFADSYRRHVGFIDIAVNIANICLLPITLYFALSNYLEERKQRKLEWENVTLSLRLRDGAERERDFTIPRHMCSRQEIKGILSDYSNGSYRIPYLATQEFLAAVSAVRNGATEKLTVYIEDPQELEKFNAAPEKTETDASRPGEGKTWFVSRHAGAIAWIKRQAEWKIDHYIEHLNHEDIGAGDTVIGTLPVHLAAEICERGAAFYFLQIPQPAEKRGSEYSVEEMMAMGCSLRRFIVKPLYPQIEEKHGP